MTEIRDGVPAGSTKDTGIWSYEPRTSKHSLVLWLMAPQFSQLPLRNLVAACALYDNTHDWSTTRHTQAPSGEARDKNIILRTYSDSSFEVSVNGDLGLAELLRLPLML